MTTLLLGGRGKTSRRIASLLHAANAPFLVASRSVDLNYPHKQAHFDWLDEKSYETPFSHVAADGMQPISTVYLVPPPVFDLAPPMLRFIDFARPRGVRRFVLLSASTIDLGGPAMGQMHEYLAKLLDIEYAVLRPTWFMGEFVFVFFFFLFGILLLLPIFLPGTRLRKEQFGEGLGWMFNSLTHEAPKQKTFLLPRSINIWPSRTTTNCILRRGMARFHSSQPMTLLESPSRP